MAGSGDDPNKRLAMYWSEDDMTEQPPGVTAVEYPYPSVEEQLADADSLLNYVKAVNQARLDYPAIADGENTFLLAEGALCLMRREADGDACLIAMNFSKDAAGEIPLDGEYAIGCDLETGEDAASVSDDILTVPAYGIVVLRDK